MERATGDPAWSGADEEGEVALTAAEKISLLYIPPPADLQPFITTYFLFRCDEPTIRDVQPAATSQFQIYLRGSGRMLYPHGRHDPSYPETLQGVTTIAAPFEVDGPFHAFGAALSPLGWMALTGIPADRGADRLVDATTVLGPQMRERGDAVRSLYESDPATGGEAIEQEVSAFVRARLRAIPPAHIALVRRVAAWLGSGFNPPVHALYSECGYSPRQCQRLIARYYGSTPTHLARIYRATRVVALLSEPGVSDARVAELSNEFYDQSHMIREIREFVGRTPTRLFAEDDTILRTLVDVRNFRLIKPNIAAMPRLETGEDEA